GAFQPPPAFSDVNVTVAPYGGSLVSSCLSASTLLSASAVGGRRSDSFAVVYGRSTLPPRSQFGTPSMPMISRYGLHVRLSTSSPRSRAIGRVLFDHGKRFHR